MQWQALHIYHSSSSSHNALVLSLSYPFMSWVVGSCHFSLNSLFGTKFLEVIRNILTSIVAHKILHLVVSLFLNWYLEFYKFWEYLILLLHEEDPTLSWEIINKNNIVLMSGSGGCWEGSTIIKVDSLQDCIYFVAQSWNVDFTSPKYNPCRHHTSQVIL